MAENLTSLAGQQNLSQTPPSVKKVTDLAAENPTSQQNQSQAPPSVERVTDPAAEMTNSKNIHKRRKDPKRVVAGHGGAAARKAKQELLLEELQVAKESLHSNVSVTDVPSQQGQQDALSAPGPMNQPKWRRPVSVFFFPRGKEECANWTPWIMGVTGLVGVVLPLWQHPQLVAQQWASAPPPAGEGLVSCANTLQPYNAMLKG